MLQRNLFKILLLTFVLNGYAMTSLNLTSRDGTRLHADFYPAVAETKAILLVVHGLQSHAGWYTNGTANAEKGIASLAFDRRGSGQSEGMLGHADSEENFMEDFDAALSYVKEINTAGVPVHVMANSLGAVISLRYFAKNPNSGVASLILTTPGTYSTKAGDYSLLTKLAILSAPATKYFASPIKDEHFVEPGPFLDWIKADPMGRREFTASFLRAVNNMKNNIADETRHIGLPLFALMAKRDEVIDNAKFEKEIFSKYSSEKEIKYYDSKHYLFFGRDRASVAADISNWVLRFNTESNR